MRTECLALLAALFFFNYTFSQELTLKKGVVIDSISVDDAAKESFSLYLPTKFKNEGEWPIVLVFETQGKGRQAMAMFREAAEKENYILASSNNVSDSLSISNNVLIAGRMLDKLNTVLPINKNRIYTGGFSNGGAIANLMPIFYKEIKGVVSSTSFIENLEFLSVKNPFHFIGIIGKEDYNYPLSLIHI